MNLSQCIAPIFHGVHKSVRQHEYESFWLKGGRGSTKSSFAALEIVLGIIADPKANAVCIRKVSDTLRTSCLTTMQWAIDRLGVAHLFKVTTSPPELTYLPTGQKILMRGLDDPQKLKSIKPRSGYFKFLWFEEAAELTDIEEMESVTQSVMRGGPSFIEFVTYNPPAEPFAWINEAARACPPTRLVHESNYTQVPQDWLGPKFLADAEIMQREKPEKYAHVYMGVEVGRTDAIIFSGAYRIEEFTAQPGWAGPYFGADWGFSQDPNVLVKCWVNDRKVYVEYEEYGIGVELDDIPKMFDKIPDSRRYKIRADNARPETISHIKNRGFDIEAAEKWQGSVEDGIAVLKSFETMIIHPRCTGIIKELRMYSYKIDRLTRDVLADIVDKWNHGIDAIRYALAPLIKRKPRGFFDI